MDPGYSEALTGMNVRKSSTEADRDVRWKPTTQCDMQDLDENLQGDRGGLLPTFNRWRKLSGH
jgi:hypothetical protein